MKLPHGDQAIVDDRKLLEYVLNPVHPVGRHHAVLFDRLLGITIKNHLVLREALVQGAREQDVESGRPSEHGRKFNMRLEMSGPKGTKIVVAVWLIEQGTEYPRLVTCYVE
ncbi:MAG: hypothetical protein IIA33_03205 [Planctomycetes bacterium]|nr:hypothetical protein [Planctomycetota bacterium]